MPTQRAEDTAEYPSLPPSPVPPSGRPETARVQVDLGALSHPGCVRPNNEDVYYVARVGRALQTLHTNLPTGHVPDWVEEVGYGMLVADGLGGAAGGEVASRLAASTLVDLVLHTSDWILRVGEQESDRILQRIAWRYRMVDARLREEAGKDPALAGMGTTMTLALSVGDDLFLGHVGDSRVYFHRAGELHQLTRDHTKAQFLADLGVLKPEEVARSHFRHVLTRALGLGADRTVADVHRLRLRDGDRVLLCTDGLTDMVEEATIAAVLGGAATADEACQTLVDLALKHGGRDNVTAVVGRYRFDPGP